MKLSLSREEQEARQRVQLPFEHQGQVGRGKGGWGDGVGGGGRPHPRFVFHAPTSCIASITPRAFFSLLCPSGSALSSPMPLASQSSSIGRHLLCRVRRIRLATGWTTCPPRLAAAPPHGPALRQAPRGQRRLQPRLASNMPARRRRRSSSSSSSWGASCTCGTLGLSWTAMRTRMTTSTSEGGSLTNNKGVAWGAVVDGALRR